MKKKFSVKLLASLLAMTMVLGMGMTVFAAPVDVATNNGEIVCSEGSYNVTVFGKALSIAGANATTIMPNNVTTKMDAMVNGKLYKGVNRIVVIKDVNRDKIVLDKGSYILDAATLTEKQINSAVKSLIGTLVVPNDIAARPLVYTVSDKGKVLDAAGKEATTMLMTDCNYLSIAESEKVFAEEQDKLYQEELAKAEEAKKPSSSPSSDNPPAPAPTPGPTPGPTSDWSPVKKILYYNSSMDEDIVNKCKNISFSTKDGKVRIKNLDNSGYYDFIVAYWGPELSYSEGLYNNDAIEAIISTVIGSGKYKFMDSSEATTLEDGTFEHDFSSIEGIDMSNLSFVVLCAIM